MPTALDIDDDRGAGWWPGGKTLALVLVLYAACVAAATYPVVRTIGTEMPGSLTDSIQHLWLMRWYRSCLLEGRSPFLCPDIQYPVGAPLGNFSPTNLQSLIYLVLSAFTANDVLCYNAIWLLGFLGTGMGTFLLAWYVVRDRAAACLGGLLAMLSTPVMVHGLGGHLELIHLGGFPLFLIAWLRLIDGPTRGRLAAAVALFLLVVASSPYFVLLAAFPAALYAAMQAARAARRRDWAWCRQRTPWLLAFCLLAVPGTLMFFSGQLWNLAHGHSMLRRRADFIAFGAPLWGYLLPTSIHRLGRLLMPLDVYGATKTTGEAMSYLGVVTLALIHYAAVHRVGFPRRAFWWAAVALLVVLSLGAYCHLGERTVGLPASWLWKACPAFRVIRVPARFNLFAAVGAAVLAAAGARHLLARIPHRGLRGAVVAALLAAAFADLAVGPVGTTPLPAMPACYEFLKRRDPAAAFVEIPFYGRSGNACTLTALCGYWQALHRGKTTGCYTAHFNIEFDGRVVEDSPFTAWALAHPDNLKHPGAESFGLVRGVDFREYAWLYLTAHRLDYIILHTRSWEPGVTLHLDALKDQLRAAKVFEDDATVVYDRKRLEPPRRPLLVCGDGWRLAMDHRGRISRGLARTGSLVAYNPEPDRPLVLTLEATSAHEPRGVRVRCGEDVLARWQIGPRRYQVCASPPFRLPGGLQTIAIESDGAVRPNRRESERELDARPLSLRVAAVGLAPSPVPPRVATGPGPPGAAAR